MSIKPLIQPPAQTAPEATPEPAPVHRIPNPHAFAYRLPDGSTRYADPLKIECRFTVALSGEPDRFLAAAQMPKDADGKPVEETAEHRSARYEAEGELARACLHAFELPAFDPATGEGWLERDALRLLWGWLRWSEAKAAEQGAK